MNVKKYVAHAEKENKCRTFGFHFWHGQSTRDFALSEGLLLHKPDGAHDAVRLAAPPLFTCRAGFLSLRPAHSGILISESLTPCL